jgi:hypothetical protein
MRHKVFLGVDGGNYFVPAGRALLALVRGVSEVNGETCPPRIGLRRIALTFAEQLGSSAMCKVCPRRIAFASHQTTSAQVRRTPGRLGDGFGAFEDVRVGCEDGAANSSGNGAGNRTNSNRLESARMPSGMVRAGSVRCSCRTTYCVSYPDRSPARSVIPLRVLGCRLQDHR